MDKQETSPAKFKDIIIERESFIGAAVRNDLATVKRLYEAGADINKPNQYGTSALMSCCAPTQKLEVLKYLLSLTNIDIDAQNDVGHGAIHKSAWYGQIDACKLLVEHGARLDTPDKKGSIPIQLAHEKGYFHIVEYLKQVMESKSK